MLAYIFLRLVPALCFLALIDCVTGSPQKITFFDQPNCAGRYETIGGTRFDLHLTWVKNASSFLVVGIWNIIIENDGIINQLWPSNPYPPLGRCINKSEWPVIDWLNYIIYSAVRHGPSELSTSQLVLYTGPYFSGVAYNIFEDRDELGTGLGPVEILSYLHFSNDTWALFSEKGYNGSTTLLPPTFPNERDTFTYSRGTRILLGSVKRGEQNEESTTTTTTMKTTIEKTTTTCSTTPTKPKTCSTITSTTTTSTTAETVTATSASILTNDGETCDKRELCTQDAPTQIQL